MISILFQILTTTILALLFILINQASKNKITAHGRYIAGMILAIGFLIPFRLPLIPIDIHGQIPETIEQTSPPPSHYEPTSPTLSDLPSAPIIITPPPIIQPSTNLPAIESPSKTTSITIPQHPPEPIPHPEPIRWENLLLAIYFIGAFLTLLVTLLRYYKIASHLKRCGRTPTKEEYEIFINVYHKTGLKQTPNFLICEQGSFDSPIMFGIFKKNIIIPAHMSSQALPLVLGHELTHCKRNDTVFKLMLAVLGSAYWFHPLIHIFIKNMNELCEQACDEQLLLEATEEEKQQYCRLLILTAMQKNKINTIPLTTFKGGKLEMKRRLSNILTAKKRSGTVILLTIVVISLIFSACTYLKTPSETAPDIPTATDTEPTDTTTSAKEQTTTEPHTEQTTTTEEPPQTTTEPYVEPKPVNHFVSPVDEVRTSKTFIYTDLLREATLSCTVYGYASKSLGMDFYLKSNEFAITELSVVNHQQYQIFQTLKETEKNSSYLFDINVQDRMGERISILYGEKDFEDFQKKDKLYSNPTITYIDEGQVFSKNCSLFIGTYALTDAGTLQYTPCDPMIYTEDYICHYNTTLSFPYRSIIDASSEFPETSNPLLQNASSEISGISNPLFQSVLTFRTISLDMEFDVVYIPFETPSGITGISTQTLYFYDEDGNISKEVISDLHLGEIDERSYTYTEEGLTITNVHKDKLGNVLNTTIYRYDKNQILLEQTEHNAQSEMSFSIVHSTETFTSSITQKNTEYKKLSYYNEDGLLTKALLYDAQNIAVFERNFTYQTIEYEGKSYFINTSITATNLVSNISLTANKNYPAFNLLSISIFDSSRRYTNDTSTERVWDSKTNKYGQWWGGYISYTVNQYEDANQIGYAVRQSTASDGVTKFHWYDLRIFNKDYVWTTEDKQDIYNTIYKWTTPNTNTEKKLHPYNEKMQDEIAQYFGEDLYFDHLEITS